MKAKDVLVAAGLAVIKKCISNDLMFYINDMEICSWDVTDTIKFQDMNSGTWHTFDPEDDIDYRKFVYNG